MADIRTVVDGDLSPKGSGSPLRLRTAIEIGHVFKLGTKYSDAMGATYLDQNGKAQPLIMGCYGIGLNRIMAAAIEAHHDDDGIIWPMSIAPFQVLVLALDPRDEQVDERRRRDPRPARRRPAWKCCFDDRDERAGFKFKDADLIGIPLRIVVGKKSLAAGGVEVTRAQQAGQANPVARGGGGASDAACAYGSQGVRGGCAPRRNAVARAIGATAECDILSEDTRRAALGRFSMAKKKPGPMPRVVAARLAAEAAINYARILIPGMSDPTVEETELSEDEKSWSITISFLTPPGWGPKDYRVFKVDSRTGEVLSMKIRKG